MTPTRGFTFSTESVNGLWCVFMTPFSKAFVPLGRTRVVVKLLRKRVAFPVLKEKPVRMWKLLTGFDMLDNISNGYFMIKFDTKEDRIKVIDKGPWLVFYHHCSNMVS